MKFKCLYLNFINCKLFVSLITQAFSVISIYRNCSFLFDPFFVILIELSEINQLFVNMRLVNIDLKKPAIKAAVYLSITDGLGILKLTF